MWAEVHGPAGLALGFMAEDDEAKNVARTPRSGFSICVGSLDLEATIAELKSRGVTSFQGEPMAMGPVRVQMFTDPDGHPCQLTAKVGGSADKDYASTAPSDDAASETDTVKPWGDDALKLSRYGTVALPCSDFDAAQAFYCDKLGFKTTYRYETMWMELAHASGFTLGFGIPKGDGPAGYRLWLGCLDQGHARKALAELGVTTIEDGVKTYGPQCNADFTGPDGTFLAVSSADGARHTAKQSLTEPHPSLNPKAMFGEMFAPWPLASKEFKGTYKNWSSLNLKSSDIEATADFYVRKVGFKLFMRKNGWVQVVAPGNIHIGFEPAKEGEEVKSEGVGIAVGTLDIKATASALKTNGIDTFETDAPIKMGPVLLWTFRDPDGHSVTLAGSDSSGGGAGDGSGDPDAKKAATDGEGAGAGAGAGSDAAAEDAAPGDAMAKPEPAIAEMLAGAEKPWAGADAVMCYSGWGNFTLSSSDMDATHKFYCETLGFKVAYRMGDMWMERKCLAACVLPRPITVVPAEHARVVWIVTDLTLRAALIVDPCFMHRSLRRGSGGPRRHHSGVPDHPGARPEELRHVAGCRERRCDRQGQGARRHHLWRAADGRHDHGPPVLGRRRSPPGVRCYERKPEEVTASQSASAVEAGVLLSRPPHRACSCGHE